MLVNRTSFPSCRLHCSWRCLAQCRHAAQSPAGYFAGKQVKMIVGLGTGGGYDLWARMVARHIGRHLPGNPTVIAQNMEGAGSFRAASYMATRRRATAR